MPRRLIRGSVEHRERAPFYFLGLVALDVGGPLVPRQDFTVEVEGDDRIVADLFDHVSQALVSLFLGIPRSTDCEVGKKPNRAECHDSVCGDDPIDSVETEHRSQAPREEGCERGCHTQRLQSALALPACSESQGHDLEDPHRDTERHESIRRENQPEDEPGNMADAKCVISDMRTWVHSPANG